MVDQTDATPQQSGDGLSSLPVPLAVSGLRRARFAELRDRIGRTIDVRPYAASSAGAADGSVADIFPGSTVRLGVFGGASIQYETNVTGATSFDNMLARMRSTESRNGLVLRLQRAGGNAGPKVLKKTERTLADVVGGRRTVQVSVR